MGSALVRRALAGAAVVLVVFAGGTARATETEQEVYGSGQFTACGGFVEASTYDLEEGPADGDSITLGWLCVAGAETRVVGQAVREPDEAWRYRTVCTFEEIEYEGETGFHYDCTDTEEIERNRVLPGAINRGDDGYVVRGTGLAGCDADFTIEPWDFPDPEWPPNDGELPELYLYTAGHGEFGGGPASGHACGFPVESGSVEAGDSGTGVGLYTP